MSDADRVAELQQQYEALAHAMQSGVKAQLEFDKRRSINPEVFDNTCSAGAKHLRTGVNSALTQNNGLMHLLMAKGVITELEYWEYQVRAFQEEVKRYEAIVSDLVGMRVTLR